MADFFVRGARETGHDVEVLDVSRANLHPCQACDACFRLGKCIQKDDGNTILEKILSADCPAFVTPVYYFDVSAQLKLLIERFYAKNGEITSRHLKVVFLAAVWNDDDVVMSALSRHFDILRDYLQMEEVGRVLARDAGTQSMIHAEDPQEAERLGRSL